MNERLGLSEAPGTTTMAKMKVMYLIGSLQVGGTQKHLYDLLRSIDRSRFDVSVCVFSGGGYFYRKVEALGIPVLELGADSKANLIKRFPHFLGHLMRVRPNVLHAFLYRTSVYGCLARLLLPIRGPRLIVSKRSLNLEMDHCRHLLYRYLIMRVPDALTAVSDTVKARCLELGASAKRLLVIRNGIEWAPPNQTAKLRNLLKIPPDYQIVGAVGSLTPRKRHDLLIKIVRDVAKDIPGVRFVILGEGGMRGELMDHCRKSGIEEFVHLPGILSPAVDYINDFSVFALTSSEEGMSNALLEAMMTGLPCVASDIPSNRELIHSGRDGILVNVEDAKIFADSVKQLLTNRTLSDRLATKARETIQQDFSLSQMVAANESLYDVLANNGYCQQHVRSFAR